MRYFSALLSLLSLLAFAGCGDRDPVSPVSEPAGKFTVSETQAGGHPGKLGLLAVEAAHRAALNARDLDGVMSYWADDGVFDYVAIGATISGKAQVRAFYQTLFTAFPDYQEVTSQRLVSGNTVAVQCVPTGTHRGTWLGIPATGKKMHNPNLSIYDFEGNKIKKLTMYDDGLGLMIQLGVIPVPAPITLTPSFTLPAAVPTGLAPLAANVEAASRWNTHDLASVAKMTRPDIDAFYNVIGIPIDRNQLIALYEMEIQGFPNAQIEIVRAVDMGGGWVLCEPVVRGNQNGPYFGVPPTGMPVAHRMGWILRYDAEGLWTYIHSYFDSSDFFIKLGAMPALKL